MLEQLRFLLKIDQMLKQEFNLANWKSTFWTDTTDVLQTIVNTKKRFLVFVANRLKKCAKSGSPNLQMDDSPNLLVWDKCVPHGK